MNEQKYLGLIIDSNLSFKKHLKENIIKAKTNLGIINHLSIFLPLQYQAALAVNGAFQGSCRSKLYEEFGWESLSGRRWCRRILQIHKIVSDKTPSYLKNKTSLDSADLCTGKVIVPYFMN